MDIAEDRRLWLFRGTEERREEDEPHPDVLHVFTRDGREPLGPEGENLGGKHLLRSPAPAEDGGVWYLTDTEGPKGDPDPRYGLRAVRRGPEGEVEAVSPLLADPDVLGFYDPERRSFVRGVWTAATDGGAYLVHFVGFIEGRSDYQSYVARIEPDGSIAWQTRTRPGLTAAWNAPYEMDVSIAEQDGGVVAVIGPRASRGQLYLWKVDSCGREGWGMRIYEDRDEPLADLEVASAPNGGIFVVRTRAERGLTFVEQLDAEGRRLWDPGGPGILLERGAVPVEDVWRAAGDGAGGLWAMQVQPSALLQHVDASGRPLYSIQRYECWGGAEGPSRTYVARVPDGGVATIDAGMREMPSCSDGGVDGGLDGGVPDGTVDVSPDGGAEDAGSFADGGA